MNHTGQGTLPVVPTRCKDRSDPNTRWDKPRRLTTFDRCVVAYMLGLATATVCTSLYFSEPTPAPPEVNAPTSRNTLSPASSVTAQGQPEHS